MYEKNVYVRKYVAVSVTVSINTFWQTILCKNLKTPQYTKSGLVNVSNYFRRGSLVVIVYDEGGGVIKSLTIIFNVQKLHLPYEMSGDKTLLKSLNYSLVPLVLAVGIQYIFKYKLDLKKPCDESTGS